MSHDMPPFVPEGFDLGSGSGMGSGFGSGSGEFAAPDMLMSPDDAIACCESMTGGSNVGCTQKKNDIDDMIISQAGLVECPDFWGVFPYTDAYYFPEVYWPYYYYFNTYGYMYYYYYGYMYYYYGGDMYYYYDMNMYGDDFYVDDYGNVYWYGYRELSAEEGAEGTDSKALAVDGVDSRELGHATYSYSYSFSAWMAMYPYYYNMMYYYYYMPMMYYYSPMEWSYAYDLPSHCIAEWEEFYLEMYAPWYYYDMGYDCYMYGDCGSYSGSGKECTDLDAAELAGLDPLPPGSTCAEIMADPALTGVGCGTFF
jgi:hypothetical protein